MKEKREKILADPEKYREEQITKKLPEDFKDLSDEERMVVYDQLESIVATVDPAALRHEIVHLGKVNTAFDGSLGPLRTPAMAAGSTDHVWPLEE